MWNSTLEGTLSTSAFSYAHRNCMTVVSSLLWNHSMRIGFIPASFTSYWTSRCFGEALHSKRSINRMPLTHRRTPSMLYKPRLYGPTRSNFMKPSHSTYALSSSTSPGTVLHGVWLHVRGDDQDNLLCCSWLMSTSTWSTSSVIMFCVKRLIEQMFLLVSMVWYFARSPGRD